MQTGEFLALSSAVAAADCIIKSRIRKPLITKNRGFARNRLDDHPRIVAAVSALLTVYIAHRAVFGNDRSLGHALVLGGALSNTYERIFKGYVTDYIKIGGTVYNISDFAIFAGAFLIALKGIREEKEV